MRVTLPGKELVVGSVPHGDIVTKDHKLDLRRQRLIGVTYLFEIRALDAESHPSAPSRSEEFLNR